MTELDTLRQQLAEAQALIEASRKQIPLAWGIIASNTGRICQVELDANEVADHNQKYVVQLYAAPVVADDVLKELLEALKLCYEHCRVYHPEVELNNVGQAVRHAIDAAMGRAA
jgi:hypothetical protein